MARVVSGLGGWGGGEEWKARETGLFTCADNGVDGGGK